MYMVWVPRHKTDDPWGAFLETHDVPQGNTVYIPYGEGGPDVVAAAHDGGTTMSLNGVHDGGVTAPAPAPTTVLGAGPEVYNNFSASQNCVGGSETSCIPEHPPVGDPSKTGPDRHPIKHQSVNQHMTGIFACNPPNTWHKRTESPTHRPGCAAAGAGVLVRDDHGPCHDGSCKGNRNHGPACSGCEKGRAHRSCVAWPSGYGLPCLRSCGHPGSCQGRLRHVQARRRRQRRRRHARGWLCRHKNHSLERCRLDLMSAGMP